MEIEKKRQRDHLGERREVALDVEWQLRLDHGIDADVARGAHVEGVTVGRRPGDGVHADDAVGAAAVVHDHLLSQILGHFLRDDASDEVDAAARKRADDEADRLGGERLRVGGGTANESTNRNEHIDLRFTPFLQTGLCCEALNAVLYLCGATRAGAEARIKYIPSPA